jgi:hypothetical protein
MTATTTAINGAINYLVAKSRTTWAADQSMFVFDGPTPAGFNLEAPNSVWIGADPTRDDSPGFEAAVGQRQDFATLSQGRTQDEDFDIVCAVQHWDGGTDLSEARAAAFSYYRTFELFLRGTAASSGPGDVLLGGALGTAGWAKISQKSMHQEQKTTGCVVLITFYVSCRARLTS